MEEYVGGIGAVGEIADFVTMLSSTFVDEIGYLTVTANGAKLFFQLINSRYGRASTVLTSNKGFEE